MSDSKVFPGIMPNERLSGLRLSRAMERLYDVWNPYQDHGNELYTTFRFSRVTGIGKDPICTRRDPSMVLKIDGKYYVWYTKRISEPKPVGKPNSTAGLPGTDWDLADIWYAISRDGWHWEEQSCAVPRQPKGKLGNRAVITPDVLATDGKFYLYYQAYTVLPGEKDMWVQDVDCGMAWSESPDGPWTAAEEPVVRRGRPGDWDASVIHDPMCLKFRGKYWLYYKGNPGARHKDPDNYDSYVRIAQGVAVADKPEGPFVKVPENPVLSSGHETGLFRFRDGVAAILSCEGAEKNTIQFSRDGVNFDIRSIITLAPIAPGPFNPDAYSGTDDAQGISWGLCHINPDGGGMTEPSFIARFDCNLTQAIRHDLFKENNIRYNEQTYFQPGVILPEALREHYREKAQERDRDISF